MDIADAREAFYRWNNDSLQQLIEQYEAVQQPILELVPLLLQTNNRYLPGYTDADTPAGIYGYKPDKALINTARQLNNRFKYEQKTILKNTIIESVYLQRQLVNGQLILWVVCLPSLKKDQFDELNTKLQRIALWLNSREVNVTAFLVTEDQLASGEGGGKIEEQFMSPGLLFDHFYLESFLMAGKYPVWWLVPPEKEQDYDDFVLRIETMRYVNPAEYINLGGLSRVNQDDIIRQSIRHVQTVYKTPESSWIHLLILHAKEKAWPGLDTPAWRLKSYIYQGYENEPLSPVRIIAEMMHDSLSESVNQQHLLPLSRLIKSLKLFVHDSLLGLLTSLAELDQQVTLTHHTEKTDVVSYLTLYKALLQEVRLVFSQIITQYNKHSETSSQYHALNGLARNMMVYLSDGDNKVSVYNTHNRTEFVIGRVLIKHEVDYADGHQWSLMVEQEQGQAKIIHSFEHLLALIAWAWLNRIVDQSTQISLECPLRMVKQIEARHVLEILIQKINPDLVNAIPDTAFDNASEALRSMLFINLVASEKYQQRMESGHNDPLIYEGTDDLVVNCEQLTIHTWGDVYVRQYSRHQGVLQCLCDWTHHAPPKHKNKPRSMGVYGYAAGISTYWAQRIEQVYDDLIAFFYDDKHYDGCFIVRIGPDYYAVELVDDLLQQHHIGQEGDLYRFLEQPNQENKVYGLERLALTDTPLKAVFQRNKNNVLQVFFQIINRRCYTWVLDEKGSLWRDQQDWIDRASYVSHWLYLMRNIRDRLKRINYQDRELPVLDIQQISSNPLGILEFKSMGAESVRGDKDFIEIKIAVEGNEEGDRISLQCDGRMFSYQDYQERAIIECVEYIAARFAGSGRKAIYVTDLDVPLRLYGVDDRMNIQISHLLKYKRNIEHKLYQLLGI